MEDIAEKNNAKELSPD